MTLLETHESEPGRRTPAASPAEPSQRSIKLGYGQTEVRFDYDPEFLRVLAPPEVEEARPLSADGVGRAIDQSVASPALDELVAAGDRVVIVVPDATRAAGVDQAMPPLLERLGRCGVPDAQISVLVGGGIHRPPTPDEVRQILGAGVAQRLAVNFHDANDAASHVRLGTTRRGTPVELNRRLLDADRVLVIGGIGLHYLAGFSGGRKAVLPGCAAERSIQANHLLSFDTEALEKRPGIESGRLEGNPVHEDMVEAVAMLDPTFLVNTVLNARNEVVAVYAGHWREAHRRGCEEYLAGHTVEVEARRPLVIVSAGGFPRDINLIQSHKALEHASAALEEGGEMIALAECAQGLGRPDFLDWFVPGGARGTAEKLVGGYKINGQTAWGLRKKAERFRVMLVSSLADDVVRQMGLEPHASLASALAAASTRRGYIMPGGLNTLPVVARNGGT